MIRDFKKLNIGIVFKDFLNQTYWTTGYTNNVKSKIFFESTMILKILILALILTF